MSWYWAYKKDVNAIVSLAVESDATVLRMADQRIGLSREELQVLRDATTAILDGPPLPAAPEPEPGSAWVLTGWPVVAEAMHLLDGPSYVSFCNHDGSHICYGADKDDALKFKTHADACSWASAIKSHRSKREDAQAFRNTLLVRQLEPRTVGPRAGEWVLETCSGPQLWVYEVVYFSQFPHVSFTGDRSKACTFITFEDAKAYLERIGRLEDLRPVNYRSPS